MKNDILNLLTELVLRTLKFVLCTIRWLLTPPPPPPSPVPCRKLNEKSVDLSRYIAAAGASVEGAGKSSFEEDKQIEEEQTHALTPNLFSTPSTHQPPRMQVITASGPSASSPAGFTGHSPQTGRTSLSSSYHGRLFEFTVSVRAGSLSAAERVGTCPLVVEVTQTDFPLEVPAIHELWMPSKMVFFSALSHAAASPRSGDAGGLSFRRFDEAGEAGDEDREAAGADEPAECYLVEISAQSAGCGKRTAIRSLACSLEANLLRINVDSWLELVELLEQKNDLDQMAEVFESVWLQIGVVMEEKLNEQRRKLRVDGGTSSEALTTMMTPKALVNDKYMCVLELPPAWSSRVEEIAPVISFVLDRGDSGVPVAVLDKGCDEQPLLDLLNDKSEKSEKSDERLTGRVHCELCDKSGVKQMVAMHRGCDVYSWDFSAPEKGPLLRPAGLKRLLRENEELSMADLVAVLERSIAEEGLFAGQTGSTVAGS